MQRKVRPHRKLDAWKESILLVKMIYRLCPDLPPDEKFGVSSQLKRAGISVTLNIAEGADRKSDKEFIHFLSIASDSLSEIDAVIELIFELNLIAVKTKSEFEKQIDKVSALLGGLQKFIIRRMNSNHNQHIPNHIIT